MIQKMLQPNTDLIPCGLVSPTSKDVRGGGAYSKRVINLSNVASGKWDVMALPDRVFSKPLAWLVVTMETVGQTNQPCMTTGSPPYLIIRSC